MKRVLLTGATGFIGQNAIAPLVAKGYAVYAVTSAQEIQPGYFIANSDYQLKELIFMHNTKKVAILQSCYIPWKGYFDMIAAVDEFILYDDMQYTRRDWRSRNQIKTPQGVQWLTVPVKVKGKYLQTIRETEIDGADWAEAHWKTIIQNYRRAPHFEEVAALFEPLYRQRQSIH